MKPTDPELVALVVAGDETAFGELYRRHLPAARRHAHQLATGRTDAEDLVSEAFVNVLHAVQRGHRPQHFRAYLLTAIRRNAHKLYAHQKCFRTASLNADRDVAAVADDPAARWETESICLAFRSLPPRWRVALWFSTIEERTPAELAPVLNLTPNGVAALTFRARRGLLRAHAKLTAAPRALSMACPANRPTRQNTRASLRPTPGDPRRPASKDVA